MQQPTVITLTEKYTAGTLSPEENKQFIDWLKKVGPEEFNKLLDSGVEIPAEFKNLPKATDKFIHQLENRIDSSEKSPSFSLRNWRFAAAAAALVVIAMGVYLFRETLFTKSEIKSDSVSTLQNDILPGGNRAILTLADGRRIVLDSVEDGALGQQGNTVILKLKAGQLAYNSDEPVGAGTNKEVLYNTISTPHGGQYQIVLSDGSKVWLNAASSLRFPTVFTGKIREVDITGEAYFEIAMQNDPTGQGKVPFIVNTLGMSVQVLGTSFNVNAYADEPFTKTTLVEGSVKVAIYNSRAMSNRQPATAKVGSQFILNPGQQASTDPEHYRASVNTDTETAWKNGFLKFDNSAIEPIMRQLARWYNIEVAYKGEIKTRFRANIPKDLPVSQVLKALEITDDVHFSITGNKVTVTP